jgi:hypothetical protein
MSLREVVRMTAVLCRDIGRHAVAGWLPISALGAVAVGLAEASVAGAMFAFAIAAVPALWAWVVAAVAACVAARLATPPTTDLRTVAAHD